MNTNGRPRVVVTGIGILSCLGLSKETVTESLRLGRSGIVFDEERRARGFRSALTGKMDAFVPKRYGLDRKKRKTMAEPAAYAYAAAHDAIADAELPDEALRSERCGIVFGNDSCVLPSVESVDIARKEKETHFIGGGHIFQAMTSTATMNVGTLFGIRGASWTLSGACASGAHSVGQGLMLIRSGLQDVVVTGGTQEINWEAMAAFDAINAFSLRQDEPKKASRPFDRNRDGLVPSGGAASLILEERGHALKRGARIYAEVRGYGFSSDGTHLSVPDGRGAERAVINALKNAGIKPEDVDYINAHATSTPVGDAAEAKMIARVFGTKVPVSSTKSMTGHECWMAGASELIYTILMGRGGFIAPNINFEEPDPECAGINVISKAREEKIRFCLSDSFGFGGTNAAVVLDLSPEGG